MVEITVKIDGMMCSMCESHMNAAIRRAFAVKSVKSSHSEGKTVIVSESSIGKDRLERVVSELGYKILGVNEKPYVKKVLFSIFGK